MKFRFSLKNNYDLLIPILVGIMQAILNFYISTGVLKSLPAVAVISSLSVLMAMYFRRRGTPKSVYTVLFTLLVFYVGFSYLLDAVYPVAEQHRAAFSLRPLLLALAVGAVVYLLWPKVSGVLDWKYTPYILTGVEAMIFALLLVFGRDTNGFGTSTSLVIAGMSFQLTEVTKIVSLMFYACVLADTGTSTRHKLVFSTAFLIINAMGSLMVAELGTFVILLLLHLILVQMYVPSCELKRKYLIFMLMGLVTVITVGYLLYEYYGAAADLKGIHKYLFKIGRKIHERISVVLNIDVDMNDGLMEVLLVKMPKDPLELNNIVVNMINGSLMAAEIDFFSARNISVDIQEGTHWTLDGEYEEGQTHNEINTIRSAINLVI